MAEVDKSKMEKEQSKTQEKRIEQTVKEQEIRNGVLSFFFLNGGGFKWLK